MASTPPGPGYVHGYAAPVLAAHARRTAADCAAHLLPHLRPGLAVLDLGCGVGSITADLALAVAPGRTVGVDVSDDVLDVARATAERAGATVDLLSADALALPFPDATFDVVHAHQVLQHLPDPVAALTEARRVLRPDGLLAVRDADFATASASPDLPGLADWLDGYRAAARATGGDPHAGSRLTAWARAAGFTCLEPSVSTWLFATAQEREWWGGTWAERVEGSDLTARLRALGWDEERVRASAAAWREWAAHEDGWMTITHGQLLARP